MKLVRCTRCQKVTDQELKRTYVPNEEVCPRCWETEQIDTYCRAMGVQSEKAYIPNEPLKERAFMYQWQKLPHNKG